MKNVIQSGFQLDDKTISSSYYFGKKMEQSFGAFSLSSLQEKFIKWKTSI